MSNGSNGFPNTWNWNQFHMDNFVTTTTQIPYMRDIPAGWDNVLRISPGAWPPGYRIANGQEGGGFPPSGSQADTNLPIRIQPPPSGNGKLTFVTIGKFVIQNLSSSDGSFALGFGVANVNGPNRPMYPYLGVAHDYEIYQIPQETIAAGCTTSRLIHRLDIVDNNFNGGIPNWPNWKMIPNDATKLYPAITPSFKNGGKVTLKVGAVFIFGFSV